MFPEPFPEKADKHSALIMTFSLSSTEFVGIDRKKQLVVALCMLLIVVDLASVTISFIGAVSRNEKR